MQVLILSPEPPYPLIGGGPYRTASLLHYFAQRAEVDLLLISESGSPASLPRGLVRSQQVIPLRQHSKSIAARYLRNARRAATGVPPLIDRLSGLEAPIESAIGARRYDLALIEHFWCAPYVDLLARYSTKILLDLHNVESVLHARCANVTASHLRGSGVLSSVGEGMIRAGHRRFAAASRALEQQLLPRFSLVLATSDADARLVREIAPDAPVTVYPNALPCVAPHNLPEEPVVSFSANFEYHPNVDAVGFLVTEIWPLIRKNEPRLRLRLIGRGDQFIRHLLPSGDSSETGIEVTGPIEDARAEISNSTIVVCPLRAGSGTRIKILEAWAEQRCVVATPLAAEGLDVEDGANIALESHSEQFARRVVELYRNPELRQRLGAAGRRTFEHSYAWEKAWQRLDIDPQLTRCFGLNRYTGNS